MDPRVLSSESEEVLGEGVAALSVKAPVQYAARETSPLRVREDHLWGAVTAVGRPA